MLLTAKEMVPTDVYEITTKPRARRRATAAEEHFLYLRAASVQIALEELKNRNLYPVQVGKHVVHNGEQVRMEMPWNNFPDVLYTFYVYYCYSQGLTRSMDLARQVLLYVFYGSYTRKYKLDKTRYSVTKKSILHGIHLKTCCNRYQICYQYYFNY